MRHHHDIHTLSVLDASSTIESFFEFARGHGLSVWFSGVGSDVVRVIEQLASLGGVYSTASFIAVLVTVWVMQTTTQHASWSSRAGRVLWFKRIAFIGISCALTLNIMTPFIIPDPPWLSGLFVVLGFTFLMVIHGLEYRLRIVRISDGL